VVEYMVIWFFYNTIASTCKRMMNLVTKRTFKKPQKTSREQPQAEACPLLDNLVNNLDVNIKYLKDHFDYCSDVIFREVSLDGRSAYLIFTNGAVDNNILTLGVLDSLFQEAAIFTEGTILTEKIKETLPTGQVELLTDMNECITQILGGSVVVLVDGFEQGVVINLPQWKNRGISPPEVEPNVLGPKDSFNESLTTNVSLIRRRLLHPDCKFQELNLGTYSKTRVVVAYISSIANTRMVEEVMHRLNRIKIDGLLDMGFIEELIEDAPLSPFPTVRITERPDKVVASLLEGRVAILQDNSPFAAIVPTVFLSFFQSSEDYYNRYWISSLLRYFRYLAAAITLLLPATYVAATTFNQEMLPTNLLITLASQREGIPLPASLEAVLMGAAFEILREAGTRLPKTVGQAVSIVGALIIGDAAVKAGIVSPVMVIITALTAIASFTIPSIQMSNPLLFIRIFLVMFSSFLGFWGIFIVLLLVLGHLVSLRSFGIPYMAPIAPLVTPDLDDILARAPLWEMTRRPKLLAKKNPLRESKKLKPGVDK